MNAKPRPSFAIRPPALAACSAALAAVFTLFTLAPRALAQTDWGAALSFDGVNDYVQASGISLANASFTLEAWAKKEANGKYNIIAGQGTTATSRGLHFGFRSTNSFTVAFYNNDLTTTNVFTDFDWHHWAATYDAGTRERRIYRDGELIAADVAAANYQGSGTFFVGDTAWHGNVFRGVLDDVRVWKMARSQAEIQADFAHPLTGNESNLLAYYRFDDWYGTTTQDATTNHFNGTLVNGPAWLRSTIPVLVYLPFSLVKADLQGVCDGSADWGDYDNDGLLDILLAGRVTWDNLLAQVWRNTGNGFTNINAGLPGITSGWDAWGDYDNDGRLDILLAGYGGGFGDIAQVWRNSESGFTNIHAGLQGFENGTVAWGDYDNDGRLDILHAGRNGVRVWRNAVTGFTNINAGLPQGACGAVAWGDYDNDGLLDILLMGCRDCEGSDAITQVWRNTGSGFTNINAGLPDLWDGSVAWGDYDNDGLLDILLTGRAQDGSPMVQVWRNTGSGFSNIDAGLPGLGGSAAAWGDYDNDGRLDIALAGWTPEWKVAVQVWRNTSTGFERSVALPGVSSGSIAWGDYDNDGRLDILVSGLSGNESPTVQVWRNIGSATNTLPTSPSGLTSSVAARAVSLSWSAAVDAQTPADGLTYNLRMGESPGGVDVVSPQASANTGFRRLPALGNLQHGLAAQYLGLPNGVYYWSVQAVDTAFAGSLFAVERLFFVLPPAVETLAVTEVAPTAVSLHATVNPWEQETVAWFEYGLTAKYGSTTAPANLGSGSNSVPLSASLSGLLPWLTYHFRAVATNAVGRTDGPDRTFTLPGPTMVAPVLSTLPDLTIPQGGSTSVWFTISGGESVSVRVSGNNPVLLPPGGLALGGVGATRSLSVVPDPDQSGSAQITITASDGSSADRRTFTLTVTPSGSDPSHLLYLASAQPASAESWRFRLLDFGTASTSYTVEYRPDLAPTNEWVVATNVTAVGDGVYEVNTGPPHGDTGFYRVRGFRWLTGSFDSAEGTVDEGAVEGAVVVFNGLYIGSVSYTWSDSSGQTNYGSVLVNGTTAVIPVPMADNASIDPLRSLTLRLEPGMDWATGAVPEHTVTIEENDANWQGVLQTGSGTLDFVLAIEQTNGCFQGQLQSDGYGFFPTQTLAQLTFSENTFTAVATNVPLPALGDSPLFNAPHHLDIRFDAANAANQTNVSDTRIEGVATLVSVVPGRPHLDTAISGTFLLLKPPATLSTNEVPLHPVP